MHLTARHGGPDTVPTRRGAGGPRPGRRLLSGDQRRAGAEG